VKGKVCIFIRLVIVQVNPMASFVVRTEADERIKLKILFACLYGKAPPRLGGAEIITNPKKWFWRISPKKRFLAVGVPFRN
jgi:hypothetical protein